MAGDAEAAAAAQAEADAAAAKAEEERKEAEAAKAKAEAEAAEAAAAAKAELPKDRKLDGYNFLPFVKGEKNGEIHQTIFWRQGHQQTVYHEGWKLIRTNDENQKWLFNLKEDPTEKNNLIKREGEAD